MDNLSVEAKTALEVVLTAGKNLKPHFGRTSPDSKKTDSAADVVTKLDVETEKYLFENLKKAHPLIGFKGEELGSVDIHTGKFWLVDPIDGTSNFVRGVRSCSTMLALVENGQVKIGIIYDFINDDMYFAEKGKGSYLNNKQILVSDRNIEDALISIECNIYESVLKQFLALNRRYEVVSAGYPAGTEFAMVACGQLEGRICLNPYGKDYDFAAGSLLVQEAGGIVANLGKNTYDYTETNCVAVSKKLFESLTSGEDPIFPIVV